MTEQNLLDAIDSVVWYNGLSETLVMLKQEIINWKTSQFSIFNSKQSELYDDEQFEVIYMIMVSLFGDYGTSPRGGWLEMKNKNEIIKFIDNITKTYREAN